MAYDYARRNELAKGRGFKSAHDQRKQLEKFNKSQVREQQDLAKARADKAQDVDVVKLYNEAFSKVNDEDYSRDSAKAKFFVEVAGLMSYDEWAARYPNGVREYGVQAA